MIPIASETSSVAMVWAWDRSEDLRFIPKDVGVAFLATTVSVRNGVVSERARTHPVKMPKAALRIAVVRIETDRNPLTAEERPPIEDLLLRVSRLEGVRGLQVDFDARQSERDWYRQLLIELRPRLSPQVSLSITALASWCEGDDWISGLPIDAAIPMLFRLGAERDKFRKMMSSCDYRVREPLCRNSIGFSTDEAGMPSCGKQVYWFSPTSWNAASFKLIGARN